MRTLLKVSLAIEFQKLQLRGSVHVDGIINSISDTDITLKVKSPNGSEKLSRYKTNKITGFNVYFRGQKIRDMIG